MGRNIEDVIGALPKQRRGKIAVKAQRMANEMIAHANSLGAVRKAVKKTQTEIGAELGMPQNAVSQLEGRSDLLVSTLTRYADALGGQLELVIRMKDGRKVLLDWVIDSKKTAKATPARRKSAKPASRFSRT